MSVIRMLSTALERAQEEMGKQTFDSSLSRETDIQPDRDQMLSEKAIETIIRNEIQSCREAADIFRVGGENLRAEYEEAEITILEQYLSKA